MPAPDFKFSLSNYNDRNYRFITLGNNKVHYVANVDGLYEALGYSNEIKQSGVLPDEFVWAEYRMPESPQSPMCLQTKIINYLKKHVAAFEEQYSEQLAGWAGCCAGFPEKEIAACVGCLMHAGSKA